jgi:hypothetical protein
MQISAVRDKNERLGSSRWPQITGTRRRFPTMASNKVKMTKNLRCLLKVENATSKIFTSEERDSRDWVFWKNCDKSCVKCESREDRLINKWKTVRSTKKQKRSSRMSCTKNPCARLLQDRNYFPLMFLV